MATLANALAAFGEPTAPAHGLPPAAYRDEAFWKAECASVLKDNWVCVGFASADAIHSRQLDACPA